MIIGSCADVRWLPFDIVWNFGLRIVMQRTSVAQAHWHESEENRVYASVLERLTTISQAVHLWSLPFVKIENGHFAGMAEFVSLLRHAGGLHPSHLAWQGLPQLCPLALIRTAFAHLVTIFDITDDKSTHTGCNPNSSRGARQYLK